MTNAGCKKDGPGVYGGHRLNSTCPGLTRCPFLLLPCSDTSQNVTCASPKALICDSALRECQPAVSGMRTWRNIRIIMSWSLKKALVVAGLSLSAFNCKDDKPQARLIPTPLFLFQTHNWKTINHSVLLVDRNLTGQITILCLIILGKKILFSSYK